MDTIFSVIFVVACVGTVLWGVVMMVLTYLAFLKYLGGK